ncbi:glycerate kinase [Microbacterium aquilitoris]|mgnify:FL=1|uniref:glycerate kinase n=1 Tax=Microbacterium aquilitoris TaxID=3067307 RepID=UPI0028912BFA|nr:glycerate kinase [Microbacterium sp. KSW2-22]MDT3344942.1 glycerate kinase [Microbacterium sp. KSW2-22]
MSVVVALDSFKGSLPAAAAAAAFAAGWREVDPAAELVLRPMADGGEGTLDAFAAAVPGAERRPVRVRGPRGTAVDSSWLLLPDGTGVVELASTSGIELLGDDRLPWDADTTGFGQAIAAALDAGVTRLVLGIGSSASTDGGSGMLRALGARMVDADGRDVPAGARGLAAVSAIDLTHVRPMPAGGVTVLSDVTNPLTGPSGAAAVFGPQKGLTPADVTVVDGVLERFAACIARHAPGADPLLPGAGAAGGTGFALAAWGADLVPGAERVAELVDLAGAVGAASLVVTGEGSFDGQSAAGKVPAFVHGLATSRAVPVAVVAGRFGADADTSGFAHAVSTTELAGSAAASMADPERWLRDAGRTLASRRG